MAGPWEKYQTQEQKPWDRYAKTASVETPSFAEDVAKSAATGLGRGTVSLATMPFDLGAAAGGYLAKKAVGNSDLGIKPDSMIGRGLEALFGQSGVAESLPENLTEGVYDATGLNYKPQTTTGEILQRAGEFAPAIAAFPTKAMQSLAIIPKTAKVAKMALGAGIGGEIGEEIGGPIGELTGSLVGMSPRTALQAVKTIGSVPSKAVIGLGTKAVGAVNKGIIDPAAQGISRAITRATLPSGAKGLSDAEALYVKSLMEEGLTLDDALKSMRPAMEMGATPSVSVTASVPKMQTEGYLMAQGSAGSRVAAKAVEDIAERQIPLLNDNLIREAVGGVPKSAEEYGKVAATIAKEAIDKKKGILLNRAKPYYQQAVGLDKSVDISNPFMKRVLENPLAVQALEGARKDPYTLTNVLKDLEKLGVSAGDDLAKLPYNATISLHAARTHLRQLGDAAFRAGEHGKGSAIRSALADIDAAIESQFPSYKTARKIYSEDSGALKTLVDSPIGQMASFAEGDYSKIANTFMQKDPSYIKKSLFNMGKSGVNETKMRESIAGAFLKRQLEEARNAGLRFGDNVFKNEGNRARLEAILGKDKVLKMQKVNEVIDSLVATKSIPNKSITAAAQSIKEGVSLPSDKAGLLAMLKNKVSPSLFDLVQKNPEQAARFSELMFTDEGFKLLEKLSSNKKVSFSEMESVLKSLSERFK